MTSKTIWQQYLHNPLVLSLTMHLGILLLLIIFSQHFVPELPSAPASLEASLVARSAIDSLSPSVNTPKPPSLKEASKPIKNNELNTKIKEEPIKPLSSEKPKENKELKKEAIVKPIVKKEEPTKKIEKPTQELTKVEKKPITKEKLTPPTPKKPELTKKDEAKAAKLAETKASKDAQIKAEKEIKEKEAKLAKVKAEKEAQSKIEQELKEKVIKEKAEKEAKIAQLKADKDKALKAEKEIKDKETKLAKAKAEKEAQAKIEQELKDKAIKEKADKEAKDKAAKLAEAKAKIATSLNKNTLDNEMNAVAKQVKAAERDRLQQAADLANRQAEERSLAAQQLADKKVSEKLAADNQNKELSSLIDKYARQIKKAVTQQWNKPPNTEKLSATVRITTFPDGEVRNIYLSKSSGNDAFDASIKAAINKASPLPIPMDNQTLNEKFRVLTLNFGSED